MRRQQIWDQNPAVRFLSPCLSPWSLLSKKIFLWVTGPAARASNGVPPGGSPPPWPRPSPWEWPVGQGLHPKPAAGAGDTSSPSQRAWASGATPEIAQLSSLQCRSGCSLPVQMGHLAGQEALHPLRCLHLLPRLRSRGKSQLRDFVQPWICCVILGESLALSGPQLSHLENAESAWACPGRL